METIKTWTQRIPSHDYSTRDPINTMFRRVDEREIVARDEEVADLRAALAVESAALADAVRHVGNLKKRLASQAQDAPVGAVPDEARYLLRNALPVLSKEYASLAIEVEAFLTAPPAAAKVAPPSFSTDPDGDLSLDWVVGDASLSVSFSKTGVVSWATGIEGASACGSQQVAQDSGRDAALDDDACDNVMQRILTTKGFSRYLNGDTVKLYATDIRKIIQDAMAAQQGEKS